MIVLFILLLILCLYGIKYKTFHEDYMSKQSTNAIKGIFAMIILFSHMRGYLSLSDRWFDKVYVDILNYIGQAMVAMYLFYSGYGIMESLKSKPDYGNNFFKNRIIKTLFNFDVAVFLYVISSFLLNKTFSTIQYLTCWIGWESVGNSNWFIFVILVLYLIVYVDILLYKRYHFKLKQLYVCTIVLCVGLYLFLRLTRDGAWWYNTIFTFPLGMLFSNYRKRIEILVRNKYYIYLFGFFTILCVVHYLSGVDTLGVYTCGFSLLIVLLSIRIKINNKILQWLGINAFSIYILQRLPMSILTYYGINFSPPNFVILTIVGTLIISYLFTQLINRLDFILVKK